MLARMWSDRCCASRVTILHSLCNWYCHWAERNMYYCIAKNFQPICMYNVHLYIYVRKFSPYVLKWKLRHCERTILYSRVIRWNFQVMFLAALFYVRISPKIMHYLGKCRFLRLGVKIRVKFTFIALITPGFFQKLFF